MGRIHYFRRIRNRESNFGINSVIQLWEIVIQTDRYVGVVRERKREKKVCERVREISEKNKRMKAERNKEDEVVDCESEFERKMRV